MSKCSKLLEDAHNNPEGLRFSDALALAECWGFEARKRRGTSHVVYKRPGFFDQLNFQEGDNGKAKRYQVMQLLAAIEKLQEQGVTAE